MAIWLEFRTQRDAQVCPGCAAFDGLVAPLELTRGVLPLHPGCRCYWLPRGVQDDPPGPVVPWIDLVDDEDAGDERSPFAKIRDAVRQLHEEARQNARERHR